MARSNGTPLRACGGFLRSGRLIGLSVPKALLYGTLAVGILDILDAFIFFGLRGARPLRILQSIAAGLLGKEAFNGGWGSAALGLAVHFFIAFVIVLVFLTGKPTSAPPDPARRDRWPDLRRRGLSRDDLRGRARVRCGRTRPARMAGRLERHADSHVRGRLPASLAARAAAGQMSSVTGRRRAARPSARVSCRAA